MKMFEKKRLHPIAIVSNLIGVIKESIFPILVFIFLGTRRDNFSVFIIILAIVVFFGTLISAIVSWLRFVYWIEDQEIRVESGLFVRKKRYIPFDRIQSISTSQGIIQRLFDQVKMTIETAGGEQEAVFTAISKAEAERIQQTIKRAKMEAVIADEGELQQESDGEQPSHIPLTEERETVFTLNFKDVLLVAITSGGTVGVIAGVLAFVSQIEEYLPFDPFIILRHVFQLYQSNLVTFLLIALAVIIIAYIIAIIQSVLKYAHFKVEKTDKHLIISHGLFERHSISVPLNRVQGIIVYEGFIRKIFGLATVTIISAGVSGEDEFSGEVVIAPLIRRSRCATFIEQCHLDYTVDVPFIPVPERAKIRYVLRPLYVVTIPVLVASYFLQPWGYLLLLAIPFFAFLGYKAYRFAGWHIEGSQLAVRSRFFTAKTIYALKNRIQSLDVSQNWFQYRKKLHSFYIYLLSGRGMIVGRTIDVAGEDARTIYRWLHTEKKRDDATEEKVSET